jgi:hypothetical protein
MRSKMPIIAIVAVASAAILMASDGSAFAGGVRRGSHYGDASWYRKNGSHALPTFVVKRPAPLYVSVGTHIRFIQHGRNVTVIRFSSVRDGYFDRTFRHPAYNAADAY